MVKSYAEATGPSWGRPGGFRALKTQKAKTSSESRPASQRFAYVVWNDTGLPRQVPIAVTSTGA